MTKNVDATSATGIMTRLAGNEEGNIIAIMAAAIIPVIGLIGGGVDMSRLYLTQARLQGACDAGALLGRKTMNVGSWDANANTQALKMFDQNFENGAYGSRNLTRSFSETGGSVTGTASTTVPMALMQVLGIPSKVVSVRCQAEMRIPHTDVMFVLDTTGSMEQAIDSSNEKKITGLRRAVKCFYEALTKQNISDVTPQQCYETADPTATNLGNVQLRFGFVPYAVNVNVGRLLQHDHMADEWTYQSRVATMSSGTELSPILGTEGAPTIESTETINLPDTNYANTEQNIIENGVTHIWFSGNKLLSECPTVAPADSEGTMVTDRILASRDPMTLTYPNATLTKRYQQDTITAKRKYKYHFSGNANIPGERAGCMLQVKYTNQVSQRVTTRTTTPVTWSQAGTFAGWTYQPVSFNVSGLKNRTTGRWNPTLSLPLGEGGANIDVTWNGCVEERQTVRTEDWDPIPDAAFDMDIDMLPSGAAGTKWGPHLTTAVFPRYLVKTNAQGIQALSLANRTLDPLFISRNDNITPAAADTNCPSAARKLGAWTPGVFAQYLNDLSTGGSTYHDIGLLWGARIMSPTGLFQNDNATPGKTVERHMVFMTDGETSTSDGDHSAYGLAWYDRRQTPVNTVPDPKMLNNLVDARTAALCKAIKDRNINLWVVSYGNLGTETNARLEACATPGKFFHAANVEALVRNFKAIAAEISALRITK